MLRNKVDFRSGVSAKAGFLVHRGEIQWWTTWVHIGKGAWRLSSITWPVIQSLKLNQKSSFDLMETKENQHAMALVLQFSLGDPQYSLNTPCSPPAALLLGDNEKPHYEVGGKNIYTQTSVTLKTLGNWESFSSSVIPRFLTGCRTQIVCWLSFVSISST